MSASLRCIDHDGAVSASTDQAGVLDGIRVVEFAQNAAIPHCGRMLAGLGADVVKVEPPQGDAMRFLAPLRTPDGVADEGRGYVLINPGKRSIAVDLGSPGARLVVDRLFAWADVALVAFKLRDLARYGIDWDHAQTVNPRLIHLTHTALGPDGPAAEHPGYDVLAQGRSGMGFVMNRSGATAPLPTRPAVNDFGSGFVSAMGVLAALLHREKTGEGQRVDTSLLGTAFSLSTPLVASFPQDAATLADIDEELAMLRVAGANFADQRTHYENRVNSAGGAFQLYFRHYQTADGVISVAGLSPGLFAKFHQVTGIAAPPNRNSHSAEFQAVVAQAEAVFASRSSEAWLADLQAAEYPCGPYNLPHEAIEDPQARANDYVTELHHPSFGSYVASGMPLRMEKAATTISGPSPRFAEHTTDVMAEIGLDAATIAELVADGSVVDGRALMNETEDSD